MNMKFKGHVGNYYHGKVCEKHPEAEGMRTLSRRTCVMCNRESVLRSRKRKGVDNGSTK